MQQSPLYLNFRISFLKTPLYIIFDNLAVGQFNRPAHLGHIIRINAIKYINTKKKYPNLNKKLNLFNQKIGGNAIIPTKEIRMSRNKKFIKESDFFILSLRQNIAIFPTGNHPNAPGHIVPTYGHSLKEQIYAWKNTDTI